MSDTNDDKPKTDAAKPSATGPRAPLSLRPRQEGSVSSGVVRQSFSHGRSKTVEVEVKRRAGPGQRPRPQPQGFDVARPRPTTAPAPAKPTAERAPAADTGGLSRDEQAARQRAIEAAQAAHQDRARQEAERAARAKAVAAEAAAAAAPVAPVAKAEPARVEAPAKTEPKPVEPTPAPEAAPAPVVAQAPAEPAARPERRPTSNFGQRAPREKSPNFGQRAPRPDRGGDRERPSHAMRTEGGNLAGRSTGERPEGRPRQGAGGETVRYSALAPRPAPRSRDGGGGFRSTPENAPATPEVARPSRGVGARAGGDRRPAGDDDRNNVRRRPTGGDDRAVSRQKGAPQRREGRLTIQALAGGDEDAAERMRSLASVRRAREREKEKRRGGQTEAPKVVRDVVIPDVITVQELSNRMATRGVDIIKFLMREGMMLKINDVIDSDTAELVAQEFGHKVTRVSEDDIEEGFIDETVDADDTLEPRPPVVTIMGHVDHGKTSLLDALRTTDVAAGEAGGITQHIGAYQVRLKDGQRVTFLDTPGHAAFSAMRARGADITDIVVLVVAADDGVMPQTIEAIQHAKAANVPLIVAVNKVDKPGADSTRVVNELLQHEIVAESLGGETQIIEVSAKTRQGLDNLIDAILLQAEMLDLRANPDRSADGVVIEAKLDKGRGPVATVLVKRGTLKRGDVVVAGSSWGRVRALLDERNAQLTEAGPATPVEILGLDEAPSPGDAFAAVENEARARELTDHRERKRRDLAVSPVAAVSLSDMMSKLQTNKLKELPLILKSDVQGSGEAIIGSLDKMATDEVRARVILSGVGGITESDVTLAKGAGAPIIGFNVRASKQARELAEREGVEIRYYSVIYDLLDDLKGVLSGLLSPIQRETFLGNAEVLQVFDISKVGRIAGCRVTEGVVRRGSRVRIVRDDVVVLELGTLQTLKRFKDDVAEVTNGYECGMHFQGFQDIKVGDLIECFNLEEVARTLD
ncbi:MAG TPA: translation initiation factor IF-2 [Brevundimonas sp.]|uniref:translation initiation factor IF-2 n=1 Tax=Brevundimonas sp. TaxID=1871086 RepID=UPI002B6D3D47|nr:translation initiation factor IF-2 [Brevundimonas sp.]HRH19079.1 translation initiation factor IF-2 [Brevundimonas sp.]